MGGKDLHIKEEESKVVCLKPLNVVSLSRNNAPLQHKVMLLNIKQPPHSVPQEIPPHESRHLVSRRGDRIDDAPGLGEVGPDRLP